MVHLLSNKNESEIKVESRKVHRRMKRKNNKNIKKKIKMRGIQFARVTGSCCWEVGEHYHGGERKKLWNAHTYHLPWNIRSIKLIDC